MAVLIEAFSVVVREAAVHEKYSNGMQGFLLDVPNETHCSDGNLSRVGFMLMDDALAFCGHLMRNGLHCTEVDANNLDIAIGMQGKGILTKSPWLQAHFVSLENNKQIVTAASLKGDSRRTIAFPKNWTFDQYSSMERIDAEALSKGKRADEFGVIKIQKTVDDKSVRYVGTTLELQKKNKNLN
jgi:hypothetical protein